MIEFYIKIHSSILCATYFFVMRWLNEKYAHCCFECLPNSSNYLTDDEIEKIVSYAESHDDVRVVSLTGGSLVQHTNMINN